jgi:hypothetical protein
MKARLLLFWILATLILISSIPKQEVLAQTQSGPYLKFIKRQCDESNIYSEGRFRVCVVIYKVENDGNPNYDWYVMQVDFQIIPGQFLFGNGWKNADAEMRLSVNSCAGSGGYYCIFDYSPTTTIGTSTVGVSITAGFSGLDPTLTVTLSWYYSVSDVVIRDRSDILNNRVDWWHDINENANVGSYVYYMKPGFTLIFPEGYKSSLSYTFRASFINGNTIKSFTLQGTITY